MNKEFIQTLENIALSNDSRQNVKIDELKAKYNRLLVRVKKGEEYLDNSDIPLDEREKSIPLFIQLTRDASALFQQIKQLGVAYTQEEYTNGFTIGGDNVEQRAYNQG